ncbi:hypothetical protein [Actinomadura keratinilytica]|uniref:hypothetical protein n=1 Tax=Actinomadura keratinilytica TaxID=547461 RepID=UPI00360FF8B5
MAGSLTTAGNGRRTKRRTRSTRRRQDVADLPRRPVDARTVGKVYTGRDGQTFRPSLFLTLTLDSHSKVNTEPFPS